MCVLGEVMGGGVRFRLTWKLRYEGHSHKRCLPRSISIKESLSGVWHARQRP